VLVTAPGSVGGSGNNDPALAGFATNWTIVPLLLALAANDVPGISVSTACAGVVSEPMSSPAASAYHARRARVHAVAPVCPGVAIDRMSFSFKD
jgi:hypothetical protein